MRTDLRFTDLMLFGFVFLIILIGTNYVTYNSLKTDYKSQISSLGGKLDNLDSELNDTESKLLNKIDEEREFSTNQRKAIEEKTNKNFKTLQDNLNSETSKLKLDLNSVRGATEATQEGLESVSGQVSNLNKKNSELETQISSIQVSSADFSSIVDEVIRSVVSIRTNKGQGSGVIFNSQGYIMTNKHVIEGVSSIQAIDYNGNSYSATLIGVASNADLAVLKISSSSGFSALSFASSSDIKVGERVIAVGNPLGLSFTVTEGIISALNRNIDSSGVGYIQTDVAINPGNSGGPLINNKKQIVGINTYKVGNSEGIGFSIPSSFASAIASQAVSS